MKRIFFSFGCLTSLLSLSQTTKPFPQHSIDINTGLLPSNYPRTDLDSTVKTFYKEWNKKYIKKAKHGGRYISMFDLKSSEGKNDHTESTSEGQGYGMMIVALMAGYDPDAKIIYDDLFKFYQNHLCRKNSDSALMIWGQDKEFNDVAEDAATDGDMDIAYSLLLADAQWGSQGSINYFQKAKASINAIAKYEINQEIFSIKESNYIEDKSSPDFYSMRTSDFMPSHFRAFFKATKDSIWTKVINANYIYFEKIQTKFSPNAGLVPSYIVNLNKSLRPHVGTKGLFEFNACRVPWRIGVDYLLYGDTKAKVFCNKINSWLHSNRHKPLYNINEGYRLNGKPISKQDELEKFEAMKFLCPFAVSAMTGDNQKLLNDLWKMIIHFDITSYKNLDYFDNTIKMLNLIILTGNYWTP